MSTPLVSVTLPCYNAEDTLALTLDSLLSQSLYNLEIVAVDDGSTDTTADILRTYAARDERVRPVFISHGGVVTAANTAIEASRGQFIARMDADDIAMPNRMQAQAQLLLDQPHIGLVGCGVEFGGDRELCAGYAHYVDWTNTVTTSQAISNNRFVEFAVPNPSIMFRRETVLTHGSYRDGDYPEDYDLFLRWLDAGVQMQKVEEPLLIWNDPPTRISRNHSRYSMDAFYELKAKYLAKWLKRNNPQYPVVMVIGAGRPSRKRSDMLLTNGVDIQAYIDVDPKKIGQIIHGRPVIGRKDIPPKGEVFILSYVGNRGAREEIAEFLDGAGYEVAKDYMLVA
ncbi:MAG: glycosyltransferase [Desulfovibrio sp.]